MLVLCNVVSSVSCSVDYVGLVDIRFLLWWLFGIWWCVGFGLGLVLLELIWMLVCGFGWLWKIVVLMDWFWGNMLLGSCVECCML